jgi:hypothetical protein
MVAIEVSKYEVILEMVDFDYMVIMHPRLRLDSSGHMHNATIDSHPIDNLSNIKCCVSFLSNRDENVAPKMTFVNSLTTK